MLATKNKDESDDDTFKRSGYTVYRDESFF